MQQEKKIILRKASKLDLDAILAIENESQFSPWTKDMFVTGLDAGNKIYVLDFMVKMGLKRLSLRRFIEAISPHICCLFRAKFFYCNEVIRRKKHKTHLLFKKTFLSRLLLNMRKTYFKNRDHSYIEKECQIEGDAREMQGFIVFTDNAPDWEILDLAIKKKAQRSGLGRILINHVLHKAQMKGVSVFLEVRRSNIGARCFYSDIGFCEVGVRKNYYSSALNRPAEDAIVLCFFPKD